MTRMVVLLGAGLFVLGASVVTGTGSPATSESLRSMASDYYRWRDQFLANAAKAFNVPQQTRREAHMAREITRLKTLVGELTLELKKSDEVFA